MSNVLAIAAHPDDIEFGMAGTLFLLASKGWKVHYFNLANGCMGAMHTDRDETARIRLTEAKSAAVKLNAAFYPPICNDMEVFYTAENLARVMAVVRMANPTIVLTHSPVDYMEDHEVTCRLAVSATFAKNMPNAMTQPMLPACTGPVAVYHAQPHGNRSPIGEIVKPEMYVDIDSVMKEKRELLECHRSQQTWLDVTQSMSSYVQTMIDFAREVGGLSRRFALAEGWRRRSTLGFGPVDFDPLGHALSSFVVRD